MRSPVWSVSFCRPTTNGSPSVSRRTKQPMSWQRQLRAPGGLVVAREARPPLRGERARLGLAVARDQPVAQLVVPRARERDDLALELAEVEVGQAGRGVDAEVDLHAVALAEHEVRVDGGRAEALAEVVDQALEQLAVVARARERDDQRGAAAVRVAAAEQPHLLALQREQRHDRAAEVVRRGGEQLVLGERVEQRDRGLVVVRALDQVLGAQDLAQLAVQQRRLARGLGVGLGREQPEHPRLADDLALRPRSGARPRSRAARAGARARAGWSWRRSAGRPRTRACARRAPSESIGTGSAYFELPVSARIPSPEPGTTAIFPSVKRYSR